MPTIECSFQDLKTLFGKKCSIDELKEMMRAAKGEVEKYDEKTDMITLGLGDTNQPYLWSVEGVTRFLRHYAGIEKGFEELKTAKSANQINVDHKLEEIRPYIAAFTAKGKPINEYMLKQLIQLQEKIADGFGRKRQKVAIGIYPLKKITFPISYKAADPEKTSFRPLEGNQDNLRRILEYNPTGKEYAWILKDAKLYPILEDAKGNVLSFPPIINSHDTGRIEVGDSEFFFEATGTDHASVQLATIIFAYALSDRGFAIGQVYVKYKKETEVCPSLKKETFTITPEQVKSILGLDLKKNEIQALLEKGQYNVSAGKIIAPPFRGDILHPVDIIEDIGIMYGYDKIEPLPLTTFTVGGALPKVRQINLVRDILTGLGYQEVFSPLLTNKELLYEKMNCVDKGTVEIQNPVSQTYSCVRSWIMPNLLEMLAKNKHADYPHRVFEQGVVTVRKGDEITDYEKVAVLCVHNNAEYTEMRQVIDHLFATLGVCYTIVPVENPTFIPGRAAKIIVDKQEIGYIGEINPIVLEHLDLEYPAVAMELDLGFLWK